jgi:hypothetical protein
MGNLFNISKNKSVHINCTLPSVLKSKDGTYAMSDENLLTQIISLMSIKYYTQKETVLLTYVLIFHGMFFRVIKFFNTVQIFYLFLFAHNIYISILF